MNITIVPIGHDPVIWQATVDHKTRVQISSREPADLLTRLREHLAHYHDEHSDPDASPVGGPVGISMQCGEHKVELEPNPQFGTPTIIQDPPPSE